MSRIGNTPVSIPKGVTVAVKGGQVSVEGPKGQLAEPIVQHVAIDVGDDEVTFERLANHKQARSNHGLMRALVNNMVDGVTEGYKKELQVIGVGYRADIKGGQLVMQLGFSHPIQYDIPDGIDIEVDKKNKITVTGIDRQQVGQVAAVIRDFRPPDSYKGKGVRYVGEYVRLKAGKTA